MQLPIIPVSQLNYIVTFYYLLCYLTLKYCNFPLLPVSANLWTLQLPERSKDTHRILMSTLFTNSYFLPLQWSVFSSWCNIYRQILSPVYIYHNIWSWNGKGIKNTNKKIKKGQQAQYTERSRYSIYKVRKSIGTSTNIVNLKVKC